MATAFVVGDKFRNKVTELLEKTDSSLPQRLREELEETLEKPEPTALSFSTARKLKKYLQDKGNVLCAVMMLVSKRLRCSVSCLGTTSFPINSILT